MKLAQFHKANRPVRVLVALEHHFQHGADGRIYAAGPPTYAFFRRYMDVFEEVVVLARMQEMVAPLPPEARADGPGVTFWPLPDYIGPWQYLRRLPTIRSRVQAAIRTCDAYILRVPGMVSHLVWSEITHLGRPYAVEVVGDPHAVFAPQSVEHPLRPFFRWWFAHQLRRQCAGACASAYVTEQTLQRLYPCPSYSVGVSDAVIPDTALVPAARALRQGLRTFTLVTVASLAQPYKALDVLIDAVGVCVREGMDQKLIVVGDGKHRKELEVRAARLGLGERVQFLGELTSGDAVRARLDEADVFVLPSRTEGLPRAMIEAMARAVPCIGSKVGGIPELLPPEDMVPPGDVAALARKIRDVATNPGRMARMSARNLEKAKEFRQHTLRERRIAFYRHGRERTEEWMSASGIA